MLDEQVEQDGVKVLIDNKALLNIIGSEMDWLEDKLNQRFIFKNPNISESCIFYDCEPKLTISQRNHAVAESPLAYHDTLSIRVGLHRSIITWRSIFGVDLGIFSRVIHDIRYMALYKSNFIFSPVRNPPL